MQHPETGIGPSGPHWGEKKHTVSAHVPLMTETEVSRIPGIPASASNLISHVRVDGNGNMSSVLTDWSPGLALALIATAVSFISTQKVLF